MIVIIGIYNHEAKIILLTMNRYWSSNWVLNVNVGASQKHVMLIFGHGRCSALGQFPNGL